MWLLITNNVFFFVSDGKIVYYNYYSSILMPWTIEEKYFFRHYLFGDKIIQNRLKINATH